MKSGTREALGRAINNPGRAALIIFCASLLFRLAFFSQHMLFFSDEYSYAKMGREIADGGFANMGEEFTGYRAPLLPVILAALFSAVGVSFFGTKLLMVLIGSLVPCAAYLLAKELFSARAGLVAGLLTAANPWMVYYSLRAMTETPFLLFCLLALYFASRAIRLAGARDAALSGAFSGLAYLSRTQGAALMFIVPLWLLLARDKKAGRARPAAIALMASILVASPYLYHNVKSFGNPFYSAVLGEDLWMGNNPETTDYYQPDAATEYADGRRSISDFEKSESLKAAALQYISEHPGAFLRNAAGRAVKLVVMTPRLVLPLELLLSLLGIAALARKRLRGLSGPLLTLAQFYALPVVFFINFRFIVPAYPLFALFAAQFLVGLRESGRASRAVFLALLALVLLSSIAATAYGMTTLLGSREPTEYLRAAEFLNAREGDKMADGNLEFYLDGGASGIMFAGYEQMLGVIDERNITYLAFDEFRSADYNENLSFLLDPEKAPPELEPVLVIEEPHRLVIYRRR